MIYDNNFNFDSAMLESDLSVDPIYGQYEIANEALQTEHAIFMKMMDQDFAEATHKHSPNVVSESDLTAIQEASIGDIFKRVKDFIIKIGKKLLGILDNCITKIKMLCTKDGKTLVNTYGKKARENFNSGKMSDVQFKWRERKKNTFNKPLLSTEIVTTYNAIVKYSKDFMNGLANNNYSNKDASDNTAIDTDERKEVFLRPYTDDKKREMKERTLGELCGQQSTDEKSFKKDFMEYLLNDEETKKGSQLNIESVEKILTGFKNSIETFNREKRDADRTIKKYKKDAEDVEKATSKALREKDAKLNTRIANVFANKAIANCSIMSTCLASGYSVLIESYKIEFKYAKAFYIKCATFGGRKSTEESALLEEISNYEVDALFE